MMKKNLLLAFLISWCYVASAQYGINAGYVQNSKMQWGHYLGEDNFLKSGFKVGVDYWFRLKNYRVEFTPELSYSRFQHKKSSPSDASMYEFTSNFANFYFNTNLYFLDLKGDCDCPTWSKEGSFINKGIFIQLSPGISYMGNKLKHETTYKDSDMVFSLGLGLGVDIGVTDVVTVTPMVSFRRHFQAQWKDLNKAIDPADFTAGADASETTDFNQLYVGVRFGFRLDEINKYGYR